METAQKLDFFSFAKIKDGNEYCTSVESVVDNMSEDVDKEATIFFPSREQFARMKSPTGRVVSDSAYMMLPYSIYKIKRILINPKGLDVGSSDISEYVDSKGNHFAADVTKFFVEKTLHESLTTGLKFSTDLYRGNTIPYSIGDKEIWISAETSQQTANTVDEPLYETMIISALLQDESKKYKNNVGENLYEQVSKGAYSSVKPYNWRFQIEYIPLSLSTKVKAEKANKTSLQSHEFTRVVNQRAEVTSASGYGRYLYATAQKTGAEKIAVSKIYHNLADIPPVGAVVMHNGEKYRISANQWNISNPNTCTVTHIMSKGWINRSNHISTDQKYRNWNIPLNEHVWRSLSYEEYIEIDYESKANTDSLFHYQIRNEALYALLGLGNFDFEVRQLILAKGSDKNNYKGVVVPVSPIGVPNSIIFAAQMKDNLSAGSCLNALNSEFCKEVFYCNEDGTLDAATVVLAKSITNFDETYYPQVQCGSIGTMNTPSLLQEEDSFLEHSAIFAQSFYVNKDPNEALKVSIQIHFVPINNDIIIGKKFSEDYPLVNGRLRNTYVWVLSEKLKAGVETLKEDDTNVKFSICKNGEYVTSYITAYDNFLELDFSLFDDAANEKNIEPKSWAITDEKGNIYIGSNDIAKKEIYFNWTRERSK